MNLIERIKNRLFKKETPSLMQINEVETKETFKQAVVRKMKESEIGREKRILEKGHKIFNIEGKEIVALNHKNAIRKSNTKI